MPRSPLLGAAAGMLRSARLSSAGGGPSLPRLCPSGARGGGGGSWVAAVGERLLLRGGKGSNAQHRPVQVTMADRAAAERACKDPNPIIDGRKANVNLAYLGAKPRIMQPGEEAAPNGFSLSTSGF